MGTPSGNEPVPKDPSLHPGDDPAADTVSIDSSNESSGDSEGQSSAESNVSNSKKVKRSRKSKDAAESSASESDSGSSSSSNSSGSTASEVSSEPEGVFKTPVAVLKPATGQSSSALDPSKASINGDLDQGVQASPRSSTGGEPLVASTAQAPQVSTPAESRVLLTSSPSFLPVVLPAVPVETAFNPGQAAHNDQSLNKDVVVELGPPKSQLAGAAQVPAAATGPAKDDAAIMEIEYDQIKALDATSKLGMSDPGPTVSKTRTKKTGIVSKSSGNREEERYLKKVLKVEKALLRTEKGKKRKKASSNKKGGKQPKGPPKKKKKSRSKAPVSSDDDSCDSSSSSATSTASSTSEPVSSDRIARIPTGRLLQHCALSRLNELGAARKPDVKLAEINEALKLIDDFELDINPQMAFGFFNQVPGTGLPHMVKHQVSFRERYGALVKSVVKFHLLLIQKALTDKLAAVTSDQNAPLFLLWQFQNDLARAPSTSTYLALPSTVSSPAKTPVPATPKAKRSTKSKKSSKRSAKSKVRSESGKKGSPPRKRKHQRSGKKSRSEKKKRRRHESSSDPLFNVLPNTV